MKSGIKFIIVGGISTFIDFVVYMLLSMKISVSASKAISMCISCTVSFFLNRKWTFKIAERYNLYETIRYIFVQIINVGVNVCSNKLIYQLMEKKIVAFACATFIAMCVNYYLQKVIVFKADNKALAMKKIL